MHSRKLALIALLIIGLIGGVAAVEWDFYTTNTFTYDANAADNTEQRAMVDTSTSSTPPVPWNFGTDHADHSDGSYSGIAEPNDGSSNSYYFSGQSEDTYAALLYNFSASNYKNYDYLNFTWRGYDTITDGGQLTFYIWNYDSSSWVQIDSDSSSRSSHRNYTYQIDRSNGDYTGSNDRIYFGVTGGWYDYTQTYYGYYGYYGNGGGCASFYTYDGEQWNFNGIITPDGIHQIEETTTHQRLTDAAPVDGKYHMIIAEQVSETQYIDNVTVRRVIHPKNTTAVPEVDGSVNVLGERIYPTTDNANCTAKLDDKNDGEYWVTNLDEIDLDNPPANDSLDLTFKTNSTIENPTFVFRYKETGVLTYAWKNLVTGIEGHVKDFNRLNSDLPLLQRVKEVADKHATAYIEQKIDGRWQTLHEFTVGNAAAWHERSLPIKETSSDEIQLRIRATPYIIQIDEAYLAESISNYTTEKLDLETVRRTENNNSVKKKLTTPGNYHTMEHGDAMQLTFGTGEQKVNESMTSSLIGSFTGYAETWAFRPGDNESLVDGQNMTFINNLFANDAHTRSTFIKGYLNNKGAVRGTFSDFNGTIDNPNLPTTWESTVESNNPPGHYLEHIIPDFISNSNKATIRTVGLAVDWALSLIGIDLSNDPSQLKHDSNYTSIWKDNDHTLYEDYVELTLLENVTGSPSVSSTTVKRPEPWNLQKDQFRPGQALTGYFNSSSGELQSLVIADHSVTITGPSTTTTVYDTTIEDRLTNGYNVSFRYTLPADAEPGTWDLTTRATANNTISSEATSSFTVNDYSTTTTIFNTSETYSNVHADDNNISQGTYTDLSFPYIVESDRPLLTGVIDYGNATQLGYGEGNSWTQFNITQNIDDNTVLLPATEATLFQLENLESQMTSGVVGGRTFLTASEASIALGTISEKTIRVHNDYRNDPNINLTGFSGTLGQGRHRLIIEKTDTINGTVLIEVRQ